MTLAQRKQHYANIHIKAKQLNLSEQAYRNTLYLLTGQRSCTTMRPDELKKVDAYLSEATTPKPQHETVTDEEALAILG